MAREVRALILFRSAPKAAAYWYHVDDRLKTMRIVLLDRK
jgi:hypothetical protein